MEILIGDKLWSSWSMRPWLVLKRAGADFKETLIRLRTERTTANAIAAGSPNGRVPVLKDGDLTVWDSLAICEHLAERFRAAQLWPADPAARAMARAAAAEMHSSFASLRGECPMDLALDREAELSEATHADIRRIVELWSGLLARFAGPFLVGGWSIADAFYTPVATRFRSYASSSRITATRAPRPPTPSACSGRPSSWSGSRRRSRTRARREPVRGPVRAQASAAAPSFAFSCAPGADAEK